MSRGVPIPHPPAWPKPGGRYPVLIAIGIRGYALIEGPPEVSGWMNEFGLQLDDVVESLPEAEGVYRGEAVFVSRPGDGWEVDDDSHFTFENGRRVEVGVDWQRRAETAERRFCELNNRLVCKLGRFRALAREGHGCYPEAHATMQTYEIVAEQLDEILQDIDSSSDPAAKDAEVRR